ncbi:photosynthetic complex assembly protein PuhC [Roseateles depolymerans]|uniref:Phosphonoacetaldehyde methylase n=1 Tax=Roseateles depolymerans TaxID=76731 RepID=A0A0U3MDF5_9BURK|nr:photosynthetic complex assembly protein PuhC [Roseateles depolymerans]ALV05500.1 Phosphonoacetaldehyde methylase [Roseateles depolymerans]REG14481.1 putative photosynthetic complex assembly protein [Roseateles depolymerans]
MNTADPHTRLPQLSKLPTLPLAALAALVLTSVLGVAVVRLAGVSPQQLPDAPTRQVRLLHFEDGADGSIAIRDARSGDLLDTVAPGTNGFLRSAVRGLARERKRQGLGPELPFELLGRADGRLTLVDPGTHRRIDLESFGATNAAVFVRLLPPTSPGADHVAQR